MTELTERIARALRKYRMTFADERQFQENVEQIFQREGIAFMREFRLDAASRPDFFSEGAAIDLKMKGSLNSILRQLKRYADHAAVSETILIATKPFTVPESLSGKPCSAISVMTMR